MPRAGHENAPLREQRGAKDKTDVDGLREQHSTEPRIVVHWKVIGAASRDPQLSRGDIAVCWAVIDRMGGDGTAWPSYHRIAHDAGLHRATVARSVERLVSSGYLLRDSGGPGRSNRYWLGSRVDATSRMDATMPDSRTRATGVVAPTRLGIVAPTRPEPASLNLPNEPMKSTRKKRARITEPHAKEPRAAPLARPDDVSEQAWTDWLALRKAKRAPVTQTVLTQATAEACKAGMALEQFLGIWCARGSQGLQADWLKPNERTPFNARASTLTNAPQRGAAGMVPSDTCTVTASDAEATNDIARKRLEAPRHG